MSCEAGEAVVHSVLFFYRKFRGSLRVTASLLPQNKESGDDRADRAKEAG